MQVAAWWCRPWENDKLIVDSTRFTEVGCGDRRTARWAVVENLETRMGVLSLEVSLRAWHRDGRQVQSEDFIGEC